MKELVLANEICHQGSLKMHASFIGKYGNQDDRRWEHHRLLSLLRILRDQQLHPSLADSNDDRKYLGTAYILVNATVTNAKLLLD